MQLVCGILYSQQTLLDQLIANTVKPVLNKLFLFYSLHILWSLTNIRHVLPSEMLLLYCVLPLLSVVYSGTCRYSVCYFLKWSYFTVFCRCSLWYILGPAGTVKTQLPETKKINLNGHKWTGDEACIIILITLVIFFLTFSYPLLWVNVLLDKM